MIGIILYNDRLINSYIVPWRVIYQAKQHDSAGAKKTGLSSRHLVDAATALQGMRAWSRCKDHGKGTAQPAHTEDHWGETITNQSISWIRKQLRGKKHCKPSAGNYANRKPYVTINHRLLFHRDPHPWKEKSLRIFTSIQFICRIWLVLLKWKHLQQMQHWQIGRLG